MPLFGSKSMVVRCPRCGHTFVVKGWRRYMPVSCSSCGYVFVSWEGYEYLADVIYETIAYLTEVGCEVVEINARMEVSDALVHSDDHPAHWWEVEVSVRCRGDISELQRSLREHLYDTFGVFMAGYHVCLKGV